MPKRPANCRKIEALEQIVADLRGPDGCPWDKEQTHQSLSTYAVEETFELVEAIEHANDFSIKDELGDVLFQVVLHSQLAKERQAFDLNDVIENISEKLVRRHPHVFAELAVSGIDEVWRNWDQIKKQEKANGLGKKTTRLDVPSGLPALQRSAKIGSRTKKMKFDWPDVTSVYDKVKEEISEVDEAFKNFSENSGSEKMKSNLEEEIGDLFFSLAQLCRHLSLDPEQVARRSNIKFETRFEEMMSLAEAKQIDWDSLSDSEKETLWSEAKRNMNSRSENNV